ncbi:hypothetical protein BV898_15819 [Hypsibius exemplaris]|uniref:LRAT domain-containing protein n=1 Tax=Hypsibius exemplaris TaxID=2072580 RepID=A0A9X6NC02_HYPEX|nr:hypothetical protein BV898_15819 [Hypsibius exemplaris]
MSLAERLQQDLDIFRAAGFRMRMTFSETFSDYDSSVSPEPWQAHLMHKDPGSKRASIGRLDEVDAAAEPEDATQEQHKKDVPRRLTLREEEEITFEPTDKLIDDLARDIGLSHVAVEILKSYNFISWEGLAKLLPGRANLMGLPSDDLERLKKLLYLEYPPVWFIQDDGKRQSEWMTFMDWPSHACMLRTGDLIEFQRDKGDYQHWGLYLANHLVAHVTSNKVGFWGSVRGFSRPLEAALSASQAEQYRQARWDDLVINASAPASRFRLVLRIDHIVSIAHGGRFRVNNAVHQGLLSDTQVPRTPRAIFLLIQQELDKPVRYRMIRNNCEHNVTKWKYRETQTDKEWDGVSEQVNGYWSKIKLKLAKNLGLIPEDLYNLIMTKSATASIAPVRGRLPEGSSSH